MKVRKKVLAFALAIAVVLHLLLQLKKAVSFVVNAPVNVFRELFQLLGKGFKKIWSIVVYFLKSPVFWGVKTLAALMCAWFYLTADICSQDGYVCASFFATALAFIISANIVTCIIAVFKHNNIR